MNVVVKGVPFQLTTLFARKFVPLAVRVKPASVAVDVVGDMEVRVGAGFAAAVIVKVAEPEVPPPGVGLKTVTEAVPVEWNVHRRNDAVT